PYTLKHSPANHANQRESGPDEGVGKLGGRKIFGPRAQPESQNSNRQSIEQKANQGNEAHLITECTECTGSEPKAGNSKSKAQSPSGPLSDSVYSVHSVVILRCPSLRRSRSRFFVHSVERGLFF